MLPNFDSICLREAKINPEKRTTGNYCDDFEFVVGVVVQWLVVVVVVVMEVVSGLVIDFREIMLTSPPELVHSAPPPSPPCHFQAHIIAL